MKDFRPLFVLSAFLFFGLASTGANAQAPARPAEASYEVSLQVIIGSDDTAARSEIPASLGNISKQLKSSFPFKYYRLAGTLLGRVTNTGSFEYKTTGNMFSHGAARDFPAFIEWSLNNVRSGPTPSGTTGFLADGFRYSARIPTTIGLPEITDEKVPKTVRYETLGVSQQRFGLVENMPTLLGSLNLPGTDGTVFLVMTVRNADL